MNNWEKCNFITINEAAFLLAGINPDKPEAASDSKKNKVSEFLELLRRAQGLRYRGDQDRPFIEWEVDFKSLQQWTDKEGFYLVTGFYEGIEGCEKLEERNGLWTGMKKRFSENWINCYIQAPNATLDACIYLSLGIPLDNKPWYLATTDEIYHRRIIALSHFHDGTLDLLPLEKDFKSAIDLDPTLARRINIHSFAKWAKDVAKWILPVEMDHLADSPRAFDLSSPIHNPIDTTQTTGENEDITTQKGRKPNPKIIERNEKWIVRAKQLRLSYPKMEKKDIANKILESNEFNPTGAKFDLILKIILHHV